ncbi:MAG TPA: hypothetical protein VF229_09025 [Burkholderiaceae bacterium]
MHAGPWRRRALGGVAGCALLWLGACGGGDPLTNPALVTNSPGAAGQVLSFVYFQQCINPILTNPILVVINGTSVTKTCSAAGCHDYSNGAGGALRLVAGAQPQALDASTPTLLSGGTAALPTIRASDMYKNFLSAQGEVVIGSPLQSRLLDKPLLLNVLHGGGLVFQSTTDANVQLIQYWINHPMPPGEDEFGSAAASLFTPPFTSSSAYIGACNFQ